MGCNTKLSVFLQRLVTKAAVEKVGFCGKSNPHIIARFKGDIFGILWHTNTFRGIQSKALLTLIDFDTHKKNC